MVEGVRTSDEVMNARRARSTIALLVAALFSAGACVLVEPPGAIPAPLIVRPEILRDEVSPPTSAILEDWPLEFDIPIDVPDPSSPLLWHAFLDYDPPLRTELYDFGELDPDPSSDDGGVRTLPARLAHPTLDACHTIEIVVGLAFSEDNHTPDPPGGDSVSWFYTPTGSLDGCPLFDAGPTAIDAGVDTGTDGGRE